MKYDVVLWDMDGTLLDFRVAQNQAITQVFRLINRPITEKIQARFHEINTEYWNKLKADLITKEEFLIGPFETLFEELDIHDQNAQKIRYEYEKVLGNVYEYIQNSLDLCKTLQSKCRQYIVTNGIAETQHKKIKLSGFSDCMNGVFIAEEAPECQNQESFFRYVFSKIPDFDPDRTIIVGDSLQNDMRAGSVTGIHTCYFNPERKAHTGEIDPEYEIDHLWDVLRIFDFVL